MISISCCLGVENSQSRIQACPDDEGTTEPQVTFSVEKRGSGEHHTAEKIHLGTRMLLVDLTTECKCKFIFWFV